MNTSIKSRAAVATLGLLGIVGLLAGPASAEPSDHGATPASSTSPTVRRCQGRPVVEYDVFPDNLDATLLSAQAAIAQSNTAAALAVPQRPNSVVAYEVFADNLDATLLSAQAAIAARENCAEISA